ncbi:hypothetical protein [Natronospora cellulosivora (SeqCode)]
MSVGQKLLDVPFPEMVYQLASAIAKSQYKLDRESVEILKIMGDKKKAPVYIPNIIDDSGELALEESSRPEEIRTSMIGAGFQPTFYQFAETIIEVKLDISMSQDIDNTRTTRSNRTHWWRNSAGTMVTTTPVDATYSSKYNYTAEGSSLLRTRLVPVPPNTILQRLMDMRSEAMQMEMEPKLKKAELALEKQRTSTAEDNDDSENY